MLQEVLWTDLMEHKQLTGAIIYTTKDKPFVFTWKAKYLAQRSFVHIPKP